jgi:hypothetical protein
MCHHPRPTASGGNNLNARGVTVSLILHNVTMTVVLGYDDALSFTMNTTISAPLETTCRKSVPPSETYYLERQRFLLTLEGYGLSNSAKFKLTVVSGEAQSCCEPREIASQNSCKSCVFKLNNHKRSSCMQPSTIASGRLCQIFMQIPSPQI